jgi:hypothetical protein
VPRSTSSELIAALTEADSPQLTVLDGPAGSGKSAIAAEVASTLETAGWFVAIARMDHGDRLRTSDQLGTQMGLSESPAVLISGVAGETPALLVIDQLDAVSIFSGRVPDSLDAVIDVLQEVGRAPNVKVLLISRTVDLDEDPRIAGFLRGSPAARRITLGRLTLASVKEYIEKNYSYMPSVDTLELLRTPLHLAVYDRLSDEGRQKSYRTRQELYEALTVEVRRRARERAGTLDWTGVTSKLVDYMSSNETLLAPIAILDRFEPAEVNALVSEGILIRDQSAIAFFHESYFDFLFARGFVSSDGDLHAFLADSGQYLFRRAQTRQVLEHLAATDRIKFRQVVVALLASDDIRSHIKDVTITLLRQIEPTTQDWEAVEDLAWGNSPVASKIRTLLSEPGWFDAIDQVGRWPSWLDDEERADPCVQQLISVARRRGTRVADLFRPHIGSTDAWRTRFRALIAWSLNPDLVDLTVELIEAGEVDDARGPIAVNSDFWTIIGTLDDYPEHGVRVIGAYLRRALARAQSAGLVDPFASEHIALDSQSSNIITEAAEGAPTQFISEVLPFVIDVAVVDQQTRNHAFPSGARWGIIYRDTAFSVDDLIFAATEKALIALAARDEIPQPDMQVLRTANNRELRFLACRALTASVDPNAAIEWLISDTRNFILGWADSPYWASRELIRVCSAVCSDDIIAQLEAVLLTDPVWQDPQLEHAQYVLLSALHAERRSPQASDRLNGLSQRFGGEPPVPPQPLKARWVESPVAYEATEHMSDVDWLATLRRHRDAEG